MMNIEKLIERLWNYSVHNNALSNLRTIRDAADALSTLQAENEKLRIRNLALETTYRVENCEDKCDCVELGKVQAKLEQVNRERDLVVADLRAMCIGGNTCAFCAHDDDCTKKGPGRKTVELCWEWRGPEED